MTRNPTVMTMSIIMSKNCRVNLTVFSGKKFETERNVKRKYWYT